VFRIIELTEIFSFLVYIFILHYIIFLKIFKFEEDSIGSIKI